MLHIGRRSVVLATSWEDGTFRCYRPSGALARLTLQVTDSADCDPSSLQIPCAWGKHDLEIQLKRSLAFEMTVVDASGKPVEKFAIKCYGHGQRHSSLRTGPRLSGHHSGGRVTVDHVPRGSVRLIVLPCDESLGIVEQRYEVSDADPGPKKIELPRLAPMKVHVRDKQGKPVPFARVQVIDSGGVTIRLDTAVEDHRFENWGVDPHLPMGPTVLSSALTNAGGHCVVHGDPGARNLLLRVSIGKCHVYMDYGVEFGKEHLTRKIELDD